MPDLFAPCSTTGRPWGLTSRFPDTCTRGAVLCPWCPCPAGLAGPGTGELPDEQAGTAHATATPSSTPHRMPRARPRALRTGPAVAALRARQIRLMRER